VDIRPSGGGENIIKYLGRYVCRTAIGDSRMVGVTDTHVSFRWKDRANGGAKRCARLIVTVKSAKAAERVMASLIRFCKSHCTRRTRFECGQEAE
jgi:hypothetical protein